MPRIVVCLEHFGPVSYTCQGYKRSSRGGSSPCGWSRAGAFRAPRQLAWGWEAQQDILVPAAHERSSGRKRRNRRASRASGRARSRALPQDPPWRFCFPSPAAEVALPPQRRAAFSGSSLLHPPHLGPHPRAPRPPHPYRRGEAPRRARELQASRSRRRGCQLGPKAQAPRRPM